MFACVKNLVLFVLHFIRDLIYGPDGRPSLLATMTFGLFVLFVFVTIYLLYTGQEWKDYAVFAGTTTTLSAGGKMVDKYINNAGRFCNRAPLCEKATGRKNECLAI